MRRPQGVAVSWQVGLILWMVGSIAALWLVAEIIHRFGTTDEPDDWLARRKRKLERNGYKTKMGVRE